MTYTQFFHLLVLRLTIIACIAILLSSCATFDPCDQPYIDGVPGCPPAKAIPYDAGKMCLGDVA